MNNTKKTAGAQWRRLITAAMTTFVTTILACTTIAATAETAELCDKNGWPREDAGLNDLLTVRRFLCSMYLEKPRPLLLNSRSPKPLALKPGETASFAPLSVATLVDVVTLPELLDTVDFSHASLITPMMFRNLGQVASLTAGNSGAWLLTPGGLKVFDSATQRWSFTTAVTTEDVRPRDMLLDEAGDSLWLYGRSLYQYRLRTHELLRYRTPGKPFTVIRKIAATRNSMWLATDRGAFFLDKQRMKLQQLRTEGSAGSVTLTQVAVNPDGEAWFAAADSRLLHVRHNAGGKLTVEQSKTLSSVPPVELVARNDGLWMLVSRDNGKSYVLAKLASATADARLLTGSDTLYSLRESGGTLFASAYDSLYLIDTAQNRLQELNADVATLGNMALGKRILFTGASYVQSSSTASVSRSVVDLSKGWQQPMAALAFEGWSTQQPMHLYTDLPEIVESASTPADLWFLLAHNLTGKQFAPLLALRYERKRKLLHFYVEAWSVSQSGKQAYTVRDYSILVRQTAPFQ